MEKSVGVGDVRAPGMPAAGVRRRRTEPGPGSDSGPWNNRTVRTALRASEDRSYVDDQSTRGVEILAEMLADRAESLEGISLQPMS